MNECVNAIQKIFSWKFIVESCFTRSVEELRLVDDQI